MAVGKLELDVFEFVPVNLSPSIGFAVANRNRYPRVPWKPTFSFCKPRPVSTCPLEIRVPMLLWVSKRAFSVLLCSSC